MEYGMYSEFNLNCIKLLNFRKYEKIEVQLNKRLNVLVGNNGSGKSSILDAISIAISTYFSKIDNVSSSSISKDDVRLQVKELTDVRNDVHPQYPAVLLACANIWGENIEWERGLYGPKSKTTIKDAKSLIDFGLNVRNRVSHGDNKVVLPLVAYYGTARLHNKKSEWNKNLEKYPSRFDGYIDALVPSANEKRMFQWFYEMKILEVTRGLDIPEFGAVKRAMENCLQNGLEEASDVKVDFSIINREIEISYRDSAYNQIILPMHMLSDGIRITMGMVADIAQRMSRLNPQLRDYVLDTPGIVLIDEIDMHLHPSWQKNILKSLIETFTNIQFIVTTHSPIVISNTPSNSLIILEEGRAFTAEHSYGKSVKGILSEIMDVEDYRPQIIVEQINAIYDLIDDKKLDEARVKLDFIKKHLGSEDNEVIEAETAINLENIFKF